jgi:hypothetical protein
LIGKREDKGIKGGAELCFPPKKREKTLRNR